MMTWKKQYVERNAAQQKKNREEFIKGKRGFGDRVNTDFAKFPRLAKLEESVIGILLLKPEYLSQVVDDSPLQADEFKSDYCKRLFDFIVDKCSEGVFEIGYLNGVFSEDETSKAFGLMNERLSLDDNSTEVFINLVREMRFENSSLSSGSSSDDVDSILSILNKKQNKEIE